MKGKYLGYIKFIAHSVVFFLGFENQVLGLMSGMVVICTPSEDLLLLCILQTESCSGATCMYILLTILNEASICMCVLQCEFMPFMLIHYFPNPYFRQVL